MYHETFRTHLNCDRFDAHEPDRGRAAVGVLDAEWCCCCVGVKSMIADPVVKQSDSHSFDGPPAHPLPSGVIVPPRLAIPRHSSSSDRSPPGLLWPAQQKSQVMREATKKDMGEKISYLRMLAVGRIVLSAIQGIRCPLRQRRRHRVGALIAIIPGCCLVALGKTNIIVIKRNYFGILDQFWK